MAQTIFDKPVGTEIETLNGKMAQKERMSITTSGGSATINAGSVTWDVTKAYAVVQVGVSYWGSLRLTTGGNLNILLFEISSGKLVPVADGTYNVDVWHW